MSELRAELGRVVTEETLCADSSDRSGLRLGEEPPVRPGAPARVHP